MTNDLLTLESTMISELLEQMDPIRTILRLADERGTIAPEAVIDGTRKLVTDNAYADSAVVIAPDGTDLAPLCQPIDGDPVLSPAVMGVSAGVRVGNGQHTRWG